MVQLLTYKHTMAEDETCSMCIEKFTKQPHKKQAKCPYCDVKACVTCTQTYLLGTHEDAHCMGCRRGWSREVMDQLLLTTWINGAYKLHRQNVLLDRERSRLPAAQIFIETVKKGDALVPQLLTIQTQMTELQRQLAHFQAEYQHINYRITMFRQGIDVDVQRSATNEVREKRAFVMPCPATGCRGFLSTSYKCGICDIYCCPDCHEIKGINRDAPHTCDENTLATVRAIKKECRNCPDCGTNIFKIEGCFAKDTRIPLWNGDYKYSQDIQIGDELIGDDGKKRTVESVVKGEDELYEIKQQNGESYTVNSKHTLVLKHKNKSIESDSIEILVDNYLKLPESEKNNLLGYKVSPKGDFIESTPITVTHKERGTYYGWSVDSNHRFLYQDFTVLRNCDQMYCTNCNTAFSWKTGQKVTNGIIHNPHYFEYLRAANGGVMPRNPGDIPCAGNLPNAWTFDREVQRRFPNLAPTVSDWLYRALNVITHIQHVEIPATTNGLEDTNNNDINIRYISKELTEVRWKQLLAQREKRRIKRDELRQRYEAFVGACADIYGRLMQLAREGSPIDTRTPHYLREQPLTAQVKEKREAMAKACAEAKEQLLTLRKIFNDSLMDISKRYKCQVMQLSETGLKREMKKYEAGRAPRRVRRSDGDTVASSSTDNFGDTDDEVQIVEQNVLVRQAAAPAVPNR